MPSNISDRLLSIWDRERPKLRNPNKPAPPSKTFTPEKQRQLNEYKRQQPLRELEILKKARNKLAQGWIAHEIAVDDHDHSVEPDSAEACKWCMSGAIQAAAYESGAPSTSATHKRIDRVARHVLEANLGKRGFNKTDPVITLASLNDKIISTQAEAVELFDKAITEQTAICQEQGLL